MGRLLLVIAALFAGGALMRPRGGVEFRPVAAAVAPAEPEVSPVAYRPGEPMLVPGQTTELRRAADGHFYADTLVNGQPVTMLVDTGASTVALSMADAQRLGIVVDPAAFQVVGSGASGPVRGVPVELSDVAVGSFREGPIRAVVVEGLDRSLLGQSWLGRREAVRIEGDTMTLR